MPNDYFQFKQFRIEQQKAAMKVCTDACLFGAWVASKVQANKYDKDSKALDIGTGTGLLALMLAQQFQGHIDAIDIDSEATTQATVNVAASNWRNRISVQHAAINTWPQTHYNLILSNPPFFEQDLKSPDQQRNLALHDTGLTLEILWKQVVRCIHPDGVFAVLLPYHRLTDCLALAAKNNFSLYEQVLVHQTEKHGPFRVMLLFGRETKVPVEGNMVIKQGDAYSKAFTDLLQDYYLYL
jgi:tRNA1Val (adenine37-N6)-methyltransferase